MPLTATSELAISCRLGQDPVHVGDARAQAREVLSGWGLGGHVRLAELVVSELVTNALNHGDGPIALRLSYAGGGLRGGGPHPGAGRPGPGAAAAGDEWGRGLELLDGLIALHGGERGVIDDRTGPGKTVYVAVPLASDTGR